MEEQAQEKLIAAKPSVTAEVVQEQEERVKARQVQTETRTASGKRRIAPGESTLGNVYHIGNLTSL